MYLIEFMGWFPTRNYQIMKSSINCSQRMSTWKKWAINLVLRIQILRWKAVLKLKMNWKDEAILFIIGQVQQGNNPLHVILLLI